MIEFGPPNASIHKIDEHVAVDAIEPLKNIYRRVLETLLAFKRAGASGVLTYHAPLAAKLIPN